MTDLSETILKKYQIRRTKKQKTEFIELLKDNYPDLQIEEGGFLNNRNIVVGDVDKADVIITAHYDTCAILPIPNFVMPRNILVDFLYNILLIVFFFLPIVLFFLIVSQFFDSFTVNIMYNIVSPIYFILLMYLLLVGKPNKHTANDNTSGVITLCELMANMTPEEKGKTAFVFFDNEENGLFGSMFFAKLHKNILKEKLIINIDCVSDGDDFLVVANKQARLAYEDKIKKAMTSGDKKKISVVKSGTTYYPSDQMNFPKSIAVAAFRKSPLGLYLGRIHTHRDVIFDYENITFIVDKIRSFIKQL